MPATVSTSEGMTVDNPVDPRALYRKITWRLIPYMSVLYILAYVDRVNVGFAAMDMKRDFHLTDTATKMWRIAVSLNGQRG